jgi:uncharacterized membrane protein YcjF (UPF0283 family)
LQAFELTTRLDAVRDREEAKQKELETLRQELEAARLENQQLAANLKQVMESRSTPPNHLNLNIFYECDSSSEQCLQAKAVLAEYERSQPRSPWIALQGAMALLGVSVALMAKAMLTDLHSTATAWHMGIAAISLIGAMALVSSELQSLSHWIYAAVTVTAYTYVIVRVALGAVQPLSWNPNLFPIGAAG